MLNGESKIKSFEVQVSAAINYMDCFGVRIVDKYSPVRTRTYLATNKNAELEVLDFP